MEEMADATAPGPAKTDTPVMKGRAVSARRGILYIGGAKIYFLIAGLVIDVVALPNILGATRFGAYKFVIGSVSAINNVLIAGTIQTVSRFSSHQDGDVPAVLRAGLRMNVAVGAIVTLGYLAYSVFLCWFEHDFAKLRLLWLAGGIPFFYALYAVFVGAANGLRQFHKQAALDIGFATTRALLVIGGALAVAVTGAVSGFVAAAALILAVAAWAVGLPPAGERKPVRPMARFLAAVALYQIFLSLAMWSDLFLVKHFVYNAARQAHAVDPVAVADAQVGYYAAVQNLARLPYQVLLSVTFIVFPLVSRAVFADDREAARRYVRTTLRYSLLGALALAVVFAGLPHQTLRLLYRPEFSVGAPAVPILTLGTVGFVVFTVSGAVLNGAGETRAAALLGVLLLATQIAACALLLHGRAPGIAALDAAAAGSAIAYAAAAVAAGLVLWRRFGAFIGPLTATRAGLATIATLLVARMLPLRGKFFTLGECAAVLLLFVAFLVFTRELRFADLPRRR